MVLQQKVLLFYFVLSSVSGPTFGNSNGTDTIDTSDLDTILPGVFLAPGYDKDVLPAEPVNIYCVFNFREV